ncbi:cytochrome P450 [Actinosynnema pretiosum subsp. pretiosum]|uniref:Cytochrome P450 n=1 Tax=Actinosynnema pretiosum subsp. pretiosum TaxID=103721 RepID=B5A9R6_9PSEU|nr:MbcS [Actinosynnema pretiosum subsp. pretiosum]AXX30643.1 putative cytochrome P450 hydroxylase [Actinosynnema pretiosum subsp. pretiosum]QUF05229.1 cytochrome P450 [Actinosynnema pretiosum subsp. pretiosum]
MTRTTPTPDLAPEFPMPRSPEHPFDPPPRLREAQEAGGLSRVRLWDGSTPWLITKHAHQRELLRDPRLSADFLRPGYPSPIRIEDKSTFISSFPLMDDPEHNRQRRMVLGPFTVRKVERLRPFVQRIVDEKIDELLAGPNPVDLVTAFALPIPSLAISAVLGLPYSDHEVFERNSAVLIRQDVPPQERAEASEELQHHLDRVLGDKMTDPADDLLSDLGARVLAGEISRPEAVDMTVLVLAGGHETTANMIALGTLALLRHPDQLALLQAGDDPALAETAVEELMRYLTISHTGMRRVATEDVEIDGQVIRAGEGVVLATSIGNRDPDVYDGDPHVLDLRRPVKQHFAFSFGTHQCLGQSLARMELQVVVNTLYRRVPTLRLATALERIPFKHDGIVYGVYELPVTW